MDESRGNDFLNEYFMVRSFSQVIVSGVLMRFFHVNFLKILQRGNTKTPPGGNSRDK